jgi:hypothetical protein
MLFSREAAKLPEPCPEQKMQPPTPQVPSRLGQVKGVEREILYTFVPKASFKYEFKSRYAIHTPFLHYTTEK